MSKDIVKDAEWFQNRAMDLRMQVLHLAVHVYEIDSCEIDPSVDVIVTAQLYYNFVVGAAGNDGLLPPFALPKLPTME